MSGEATAGDGSARPTSGPALALFQPDIAGNAGTILRLGACFGLPVHVVGPAGFSMDDRAFRRAGMDYLAMAALTRHDGWAAFEAWRQGAGRRLVLFTTSGAVPYTDVLYTPHDVLLFGRESAGVPDFVHAAADVRVAIPMLPEARSLNLAVAAGIAAAEALRQTGGGAPGSGSADEPGLVPELDVADFDRSLGVYRDVFGFAVRALRPEERFAYLVRETVHLMLEEAAGPGRRFRTAPLEPPFGRGVNLQIAVADVDALHAKVEASGLALVVPLEERWYRQNAVEHGLRQFVVADPDGYLLRFQQPLGVRPAAISPPSAGGAW